MRKYEWLDTSAGRLSRYRRRCQRRLHIVCAGIEPRAKKAMPENDKIDFRRDVLRQLKEQGRRAFRGSLFLEISLLTSHRNPPHVHTIAKNLLDLLATPRPVMGNMREGVLYRDDGQVAVLSVSCAHGAGAPTITIRATAFGDFLNDLNLAMHALEEIEHRQLLPREREEELHPMDVAALRRDELTLRSRLGDARYRSLLDRALQEAQLYLLRQSGVSVRDMGYLYGLGGNSERFRMLLPELSRIAAPHFRDSPFRIVLTELPQQDGTSAGYKRQVETQILAFHRRFRSLLSPLQIPVALQVVIKPSDPARSRGQHDLDNVVREYLMPKILEILEPPSTGGSAAILPVRSAAFVAASDAPSQRVQVTRERAETAVMRYEAWRLMRHPTDTEPGFVTMDLIPDMNTRSPLSRIDSVIGQWDPSI